MNIIFAPTYECNISCDHCYLDKTQHPQRISAWQAKALISKLPPGSQIVFHGGEPSILGPAFYSDVCGDYLKTHRFSMQTNLVDVDERWAPSIKALFNGAISTSCDVGASPRPFSSGDWLDNAQRLRSQDIRLHAISMLCAGNQDRPLDIYDFFNRNGFSFRLNPVTPAGAAHDGKLMHSAGKYAAAVNTIFDAWFMDPQANVLFNPGAEILLSIIIGSSFNKCPYSSNCSNHICAVSPGGDLFPCGIFIGNDDFRYGNILSSSFEAAFRSSVRTDMTSRHPLIVSECGACEHFNLCGGGCKAHSYLSGGSINGKTPLCEEYRQIYSHIKGRLAEVGRQGAFSWVRSLDD